MPPDMPSFDQQVTFLSVADLERSTTFYADTLGLALVLDQGDCRIFAVAASAFVGVCMRPDAVLPDGVILTLVTDDVDGCHARLVASGVTCERAPSLNRQYRIYQAFYRDPDGYLIEIQRFLDPAWPAP
jgi:catechol 2,3-dioxygenase-like lactoylglutathione lyase family enzyme